MQYGHNLSDSIFVTKTYEKQFQIIMFDITVT